MPRYGSNPSSDLSPRDCPICGTTFQPYRDNHRTCSRSCRAKLPEVRAVTRAQFANPELRERKNAARRVAVDPEGARARNLANTLRRYGLDVATYRSMLEAQGGRCAMCGATPRAGGVKAASRLHVDHDHLTGRVRALLCNGCNRGIGYLQEDPELLRRAADYIERFRET